MVRDSYAQFLNVVYPRRDIVDLVNDHVTGVATPPLDVTPAGGIGCDRRDAFQELVSNRPESVLQPEDSDPRINVASLNAQNGLNIERCL